MTFYMLLNQVASVFLSLNVLTTLTFDSEVQSYLYGGSQTDLFVQLTNNSRTLALKSKTEGELSNLLVITKNRKFYFDLKLDKHHPHQFVEVKHGLINMSSKSIVKNKRFEILEGKTSLTILNKSKKEIQVNGLKVKTKDYFSKGVPIFIDGARVLY